MYFFSHDTGMIELLEYFKGLGYESCKAGEWSLCPIRTELSNDQPNLKAGVQSFGKLSLPFDVICQSVLLYRGRSLWHPARIHLNSCKEFCENL